MNKFVTIGYKKDGKAEVIYSPNVPCQKQKTLFKEHSGKGYILIEIWSRENGLVKKRRIPSETKKQKSEIVKVETQKVEQFKIETPETPIEAESPTIEAPSQPETSTLEETQNNEQ